MVEMYLIDSDFLIGYIKNKKEVTEILDDIGGSLWSTSVVCVAEVLEGVSKHNAIEIKKMLKDMVIYDVDWEVAEVFAKLRKKMRKQGNLIDNMDLFIASTCLVHDLTLITGNKKHFSRVKGLKIIG